jgi:hypothetical protein
MVNFINILPLCNLRHYQNKLYSPLRAPTQCFKNVPAYFGTAVSYERKIFMKSTPVVNVVKLFTAVIYDFS